MDRTLFTGKTGVFPPLNELASLFSCSVLFYLLFLSRISRTLIELKRVPAV